MTSVSAGLISRIPEYSFEKNRLLYLFTYLCTQKLEVEKLIDEQRIYNQNK